MWCWCYGHWDQKVAFKMELVNSVACHTSADGRTITFHFSFNHSSWQKWCNWSLLCSVHYFSMRYKSGLCDSHSRIFHLSFILVFLDHTHHPSSWCYLFNQWILPPPCFTDVMVLFRLKTSLFFLPGKVLVMNKQIIFCFIWPGEIQCVSIYQFWNKDLMMHVHIWYLMPPVP